MDGKRFDRRITIERYDVAFNDDNEPIEAWEPIATVRAIATPVSDGEKVRAAEVGATISMRFQVRYSMLLATVTPKDRLLFDGKYFDIVGIKELGRREGYEISAAAAADEVAILSFAFDFDNASNSQFFPLIAEA